MTPKSNTPYSKIHLLRRRATSGDNDLIESMTGKSVPLEEEDDPELIHSRTTNSVVIQLRAPQPMTAPLFQVRLKVDVRTDEPDLQSLVFCALVNVPLSRCQQ